MSLVIYFFGCVAIFLPTVFSGNISCSTCPSNPPQSPSQCNMSTTTTECGHISESFCFAVTVELNNGSFTSLKGCFVKNTAQDVCTNTTACQRAENDTGVGFKRCVGKCCQNDDCNKRLVPDPWKVEPSSTAPAPTSISTPTTSAASTKGTSALIKIEALYLLLIFLLL